MDTESNPKREASPETQETCKKLKSEIGDRNVANDQTDKQVEQPVEQENATKHNNNTSSTKNNNNNTNNNNKNSNGPDKIANGNKTKTESSSVDVDQSKPEDKVQTNGNKKDSTKAEVEESKKSDKPAESSSKDEKESDKAESQAQEEQPESADEEEEEERVGTLLICGGANWDMTGRKELPKSAKKPVETNPGARNLWGPHKVVLDGSDKRLRVRGVFSGCNACHSVIVTDEGVAMTFGRNDKGQLGLGDTDTRITPTVVKALEGLDIVAASCGRSHTLFLTSEGVVYGCGDNKMGQCGTNQQSVHTITTPSQILFKEGKRVKKVACGAEFSMIIDVDGRLYSFGHPEHGQLGHNSEEKYFTSGNKYAFHCEYFPRRISHFIEKSREGHVTPISDVTIVDVACGTNHALAVDTKGRCYSWGFAGYHRLGHSETKNELVPRSIKVFDAPKNSGRGAARVFAGASHSLALDQNGLLYFWGQNKSSGEATMYPKNVQDLCGWNIRAVACANRSIFVLADESSVSWGPSPTYGELGYGEGKSKSSTTPQEVRTLDGIHVDDVACGFGHTLLIARDKTTEEQTALEKFKAWP